MYSLIAIACSLLLIGGSVYLFKRKEHVAERYIKILTLIFCFLGLSRLLLSDGFVEVVFEFAHPLQSFLRWGYYIGYAVLPMAVFTESRLFRNIASYFSSTVTLLCMIFFNDTMAHFLSDAGGGFRLVAPVRYVLYIAELCLGLGVCVLMQIHTRHRMNVRCAEEWRNLALGLPLICLQMMPAYIPQALVGYTDIPYGSFSPFHLGWMVLIGVECVCLWFYFRHRSERDKYNLCLFLCIAQLFHTMSIFLRGFTLSRMPIQLCSIAAFFYIVTIVTRSKRLFGFCYLTNIVGALVAIVLAAFDVGALSFWTMHYIYEHTFVMLMPILATSLGIFPRLKLSDLKVALGIFTVYFLFCLTSGSIINGITGVYTVNYFYMFNLEVALDYVPFAAFTGALSLPIGTLTLYPLLILVIYVVFVALIALFYGFTRGLYAFSDKVLHGERKLRALHQ